MSKLKRLQEIKFLGFRKGLLSSSEPNASVEGLTRSLNLLNYTRPEKLQSRPSYRLKYTSPIGTDNSLRNEEFIFFDNYFDRKTEGAEITLYLTRATTVSEYTGFTLDTLQVYARPFYNGSFWVDSWKNLTKLHITTIKSFETVGALKYIKVNGNYGNLTQWKFVNYTANKKLPYAIIKSYNNGNDTMILLNNQYAEFSFNVGDVIVLMQDYIPIRTLQANAGASKQDVEFIRGTNKAIIGFGGYKDRRALVIEHIDSWLYFNTNPYILNQTEDENFRHTNRLVIDQIVTEYEVVKTDTLTDVGNLPAGTYSGISVLNFLGTELQINNEKQVTLQANSRVTFYPYLHLGFLSRRLQSVELFFNHDLLNHYKARTFEVSGNDKTNKNWITFATDYYQLSLSTAPASMNIHNENCATSPSNSNSVGSWLALDTVNYDGERKVTPTLGSDAGDYYVEALCQQVIETDSNTGYGINEGELFYPLDKLDKIPTGEYVISVKVMIFNSQSNNNNEVSLYAENDIGGVDLIRRWHLNHNTWQTETINFNFTKDYKYLTLSYNEIDVPPNDLYLRFADLRLIPRQNQELDSDTQFGEELYTRLGYIGDLVKDFGVSHVRQQQVFVSSAWINEKYRTTVFKNAINSDGSNMQTIIPAESALEIESVFGQNIIGIGSVPNSNLVVFTESTITILDAERGVSIERIVGSGLKSKLSLISIKGSLYYVSDNDIYKISPSSGYIPSPITAFTIRNDYNKILRKDLITACFDRYSAYRLSLDESETIEYKELIFVDEFGFSEMQREHHPILLRNGMFGFVWFAGNDFNIYSEPYNLEEVIGYADKYGDYRAGW